MENRDKVSRFEGLGDNKKEPELPELLYNMKYYDSDYDSNLSS